MAQAHDEVEPDLSHIHWSFPEAIASNPARSLATPDLAMDYFAYSPFWDPKSNNNVLRTQRRIEQPSYGHAEEKLELNAFKSGFEYVVAHANPPEMFIIHRRDVRPDGRRDQVSGIYWILQDRVYPTPTLYDIMASRTKNAAHLISETFSTLSAMHPPSNPRTSSLWRSLPPNEKRAPGQAQGRESDAQTPAGGDVDMSAATVEAEDDDAAKEEDEGEPDWNLFHALQSTRGAMGELQQMAREPARSVDVREEMRAVEIRSSTGPASTVPPLLGRSSSVETPGTRIDTPTFMAGPVGGRLRTTSNVGSSPLAR